MASLAPPDAETTWIDRMPVAWRPYLRLSRLDRPVGAWLLFWPCIWGLLLAALSGVQGSLLDGLRLAFWFALGSVAMRGAGCTWNDILDRDLDAQVARTRARPLPSGQVTTKQALAWALAQCLLGLVVLLQLNRVAALVALGSILLVAAYPLMKRITWWPQAWLGLTFNWGALVGYAALGGDLAAPAPWLLYLGGVFWTLGYDTIYALQDVEDDALAGVKSSARALGSNVRRGVALFYLASVVCMVLACGSSGLWAAAVSLLPFAGHLGWQVTRMSAGNTYVFLGLFRSNRIAGAIPALTWGLWLALAKT